MTDRTEKIFTQVFRQDYWTTDGIKSGAGSSLEQSKYFRNFLGEVLSSYNIQSVVDCSCGDWTWMKEAVKKIPLYTGIDIVKDVIQSNTHLYGSDTVKFIHGDSTELLKIIQPVDLSICRHTIEHLNNTQIANLIDSMSKASRYGIITTTSINGSNIDGEVGGYRRVDLTKHPFSIQDKHNLLDNRVESTLPLRPVETKIDSGVEASYALLIEW